MSEYLLRTWERCSSIPTDLSSWLPGQAILTERLMSFQVTDRVKTVDIEQVLSKKKVQGKTSLIVEEIVNTRLTLIGEGLVRGDETRLQCRIVEV